MRPYSYKNQMEVRPSFNSERPPPNNLNVSIKKINEKTLLEDKTTQQLVFFLKSQSSKKIDRPVTAIQKKQSFLLKENKAQDNSNGISQRSIEEENKWGEFIKKMPKNKYNKQEIKKQKNFQNTSNDQLENIVDDLLKGKNDHDQNLEQQQIPSQNLQFQLPKRSNSTRLHSRPVTAGVNIKKPPLAQKQKNEEDSFSGINRYAFQHVLGTGSYASVRLARDKLTDKQNKQFQQMIRQVAIKSYQKSRLCDPQRRQNLRREISILKRLDHPNIIQFQNTIDTPTDFYLIMEYGGSSSLRQYMKQQQNRKLPENEVKIIFRQTVKAIEYCHSQNVVHRDIKMENILLSTNDYFSVKLIDFGFSVIIQNDAKLSIYCGTPSYMAPEIVSKQEYLGKPIDIWSLGVLLYAMLVGQFPFRGRDDKELYSQIKSAKFKQPAVTSSCMKLISSIFRIKPNERPTASQILMDPWLYN